MIHYYISSTVDRDQEVAVEPKFSPPVREPEESAVGGDEVEKKVRAFGRNFETSRS